MKRSPTTIVPTGRFKLPVLVSVMVCAVIAGAYLVKVSLAASGSMTVGAIPAPAALGQNFTVSVRVNPGGEVINAVMADLTFQPSQLQLVSIDTSTTAFPTVAQSTSDNTAGTARIAAGTSGGAPGVSTDSLIANVTFKAVGLGATTIGLANTSVALRVSDSTDVLVARNASTINITDQAAPSAPASLTSSGVSVTQVTLNWTTSTDNVGVTGYKVFRGGTQIATTAGTVLTYTDSNLTPATGYSYSVAAVDAAGNVSSQSSSLTVSTLADTTAPSVPTSLQKSTSTLTSVGLNWAASTDNVAVTGYKVFRGGALIATLNGTATGYSDTNLVPGTTYAYTVAAFDAAGNTSAQSATLNAATLPDTTAPTVPGNFTIGTKTATTVQLSWIASTDNVAVTGYKVFRNAVQIATSSTNSITAALPTTAGTYSYTVAAYDAVGNTSAQSTAVPVIVYSPSDINLDGKVDVFDLSTLLSKWGTNSASSDINHNGVVDVFDLSMLLSAWTG